SLPVCREARASNQSATILCFIQRHAPKGFIFLGCFLACVVSDEEEFGKCCRNSPSNLNYWGLCWACLPASAHLGCSPSLKSRRSTMTLRKYRQTGCPVCARSER